MVSWVVMLQIIPVEQKMSLALMRLIMQSVFKVIKWSKGQMRYFTYDNTKENKGENDSDINTAFLQRC